MRASLEEGINVHRFAGIFPAQFFTEAGRHREAVVAADQHMVIRSFGDDLAGFVHDGSHAYHSWRQSSGSVDLDHSAATNGPCLLDRRGRFILARQKGIRRSNRNGCLMKEAANYGGLTFLRP
jgi:hypothetical protein